MRQTDRARSTVIAYLEDFILRDRPASIAAWVPEGVSQRIAAAVRQAGTSRLKPIFLALGEKVPYDVIRLAVAHLAARAPGNAAPGDDL
jgi:ATP-dependent DNA helicase RecQ